MSCGARGKLAEGWMGNRMGREGRGERAEERGQMRRGGGEERGRKVLDGGYNAPARGVI